MNSMEMRTFSNHSPVLQEFLERRNFIFQGYEMNLKELLYGSLNRVDLEDIIDSDVLQKLANNENIVIGSVIPHMNDPCYIRRIFQDFNGDTIPEKDIYNIVNLEQNITFIVDRPGAGKTTALQHLTITLKNMYPYLWIVNINLADYFDIFEELISSSESFTIEDLLNRKTNLLNTNFEKQLFSVPNKVLLMIDGVDEICNEYDELALNVLEYCASKPNLVRMFIISLPNAHPLFQKLSKLYEIHSIELKPLPKEDQLNLFEKYWVYAFFQFAEIPVSNDIKRKCKLYAEKLITERWVDEENKDVGVPLQIRMLVEIFDDSRNFYDEMSPNWQGFRDFFTSSASEPLLPINSNVVELCQLFIYKNITTIMETKPKRNLIRSYIKKVNESCSCYLYILALEVTLSKIHREIFTCYKRKPDKVPTTITTFGIIKIVDDRLRFVHRIFAEYFLAECILDHLLEFTDETFLNMFVKVILCSPLFRLVRLFLAHFLRNDIDSIPVENLKCIGHILHRDYLNPYVNIDVPRDSEGFLNFIFKCFDLHGASPDLRYAKRYNTTALHLAVKRKQLNEVMFLIEKGTPIDIRNSRGQSVLHVSVDQCSLDITQYLLNNGANVNCKDANGESSLHIAAKNGTLHAVKYLVEQGANINSRDKDGCTPLIQAAENGAIDVVQFLVSYGADINSKTYLGSSVFYAIAHGFFDIALYLIRQDADVTLTYSLRNTLLHITCADVYASDELIVKVAKRLIEKGVDMNSRNWNRETAFSYSIANKAIIKVVEYLVENGADINEIGCNNYTPLDMAISQGAFEIVKYLTEKGAERGNRQGALDKAVRGGYLDVIKYLAEKGENLNIRNDFDQSMLFVSIGNCEVSKFLLDQGADVNYGCPLNQAITIGDVSTVKLLIQHGAYASSASVQLAAGIGNLQMLKWMVGVSVGIREIEDVGDNLKVLEYLTEKGIAINKVKVLRDAAGFGNISIIKFLIERGVNVNENVDCYPALHEACSRNQLHAVKYLVKHGADVNILDPAGYSALYISANEGYFDIANILVKNGALINRRYREMTPIHVTVANEDFNMLTLFLENGGDITIKDVFGATVLGNAIQARHLQMIDFLLKYNPYFDFEFEEVIASLVKSDRFFRFSRRIITVLKYLVEKGKQLNFRNINCPKLLSHIATTGDLELIKFLLKEDVHINFLGNGNLALYVTPDLSIAKCLVEHGADVNAKMENNRTSLHNAAKYKDLDMCRFLVEAGSDVNALDESGVTPLYDAASCGSFSKVKYLIEKGAKLSRTNEGRTELHEIAKSKDLDLTCLLLENGADVNAKDFKGRSVLQEATKHHNIDMVKLLIEKGAKIYYENHFKKFRDIVGLSYLLLDAVEACDLDVVKYLVKCGVKINVKDDNGNTPLHKAVVKYDSDMVRFLLESGAHVNTENNMKLTPFQITAVQGDLYTAKILVKHGADISNRDENGRTALFNAVENKHPHLVKYLLERGADINAKTNSNCTVLQVAIKTPYNYTDIIRLNHDANVEDTYSSGHSILQPAITCSQLEVIKALITYHANVNMLEPIDQAFLLNEFSRNTYSGTRNAKRIWLVQFLVNNGLMLHSETGYLLLQGAAANGDLEVVQYLLSNGLNPNVKMGHGYTALHIAAKEDHVDVLKCLIEYGADINITNDFGLTALHVASSRNCLKAVIALIDLDTDVNVNAAICNSLLDIAIFTGSYAVVKYLKKWMRYKHRNLTIL